MTALSIILDIVLILISLVLIVAVLMQQGQRQGLGAIAGGAETFFGKGKAKGIDAKLAKITKIAATVFIILAIVTTLVVAKANNTDADPYVHDDHIHLEDGTITDLEGNVMTEGEAAGTEDTAEASAEPAAEATAEPAAEATAEPAAEATAAAE